MLIMHSSLMSGWLALSNNLSMNSFKRISPHNEHLHQYHQTSSNSAHIALCTSCQSLCHPSVEIFALPQENCIQLAIDAINTAGYKLNGNQQLSTHKAAGLYQVPRSTLGDCMKGLCIHAEVHINQQKLSLAEEEVLVKWAKVLGRWGVPLTHSPLTTYVSEILGKPIGKSWAKRFLARHAGLKVKATTSLEKCCAKALNPVAVARFFDILEAAVEEFGIKPENTWNMDEKGVQLGIGVKVAAIIDHDQSTVYSVEDGNHELVTVIEAVCANGMALIPSVIFQGVHCNLEWGRPEKNPSSARCSTIWLYKSHSITPFV